jgi:hypothetical protein
MPFSVQLRFTASLTIAAFLLSISALAQELPLSQENPSVAASPTRLPGTSTPPKIERDQITIPIGTHLPLILRNGVNTKSAKPGDAVYFETTYPIGIGNQMAIPVGTFLRGQITEVKRPGRLHGRGEFRILLTEITFSTGYTVNLMATPSSVDMDGKVAVSPEGKITGPDGGARDAATVGLTTLAGGPVGGYAGLLAGSANARNLAIGHGAGAAAGLLFVLLTRGPEAELPRETTIDVQFNRPLFLDPAFLPSASTPAIDPSQRFEARPVTLRKRPRERQRMGSAPLFLWPMFMLHP